MSERQYLRQNFGTGESEFFVIFSRAKNINNGVKTLYGCLLKAWNQAETTKLSANCDFGEGIEYSSCLL